MVTASQLIDQRIKIEALALRLTAQPYRPVEFALARARRPTAVRKLRLQAGHAISGGGLL